MKALITFSSLIVAQLLTTPAAFAYIYAELEVSHSGRCIQTHSDSAESILRRNGIRASGSYSSRELNALAKGIAQVERINGGPLPAAWHTQFNFLNARGAWNQGANAINVRKLSYGGDNVGAMMHEFGHKVANANGQRILNQYLRSASPCGFTGYARKKRSEEFGEVFSAFITNPDDLRGKCPSAYSALKKIFNGSENTSMASCSHPSKPEVVLARKNPPKAPAPVAPTNLEANSSGSFDDVSGADGAQ